MGVLLQIPLAAAPLLVARVLTGVAHTLGRTLVGELKPARFPAPLALAPVETALLSPPRLALGYAERAPPSLIPR